MYYSITMEEDGWSVQYGEETLAKFETHAEAEAFIKGRRSVTNAV